MTNEQFAAYLLDESHLYTVGYEELKTLVMTYPYSTNLRVLLLKKSLLEKNKDIDRNTAMAATYTTNRRQLSKLVKRLKNPQKVSENVLLGTDFLELTELSNLDKVLAEKTIPLDFSVTGENEKTLSAEIVQPKVFEPILNNLPELAAPAAIDLIPEIEKSGVVVPEIFATAPPEMPIIAEDNRVLPIENPVYDTVDFIESEKETVVAASVADRDEYRAISVIEDDYNTLPYMELLPVPTVRENYIHTLTNSNVSEMPIEFEILNTDKTIVRESEIKAAPDANSKMSFTNWLQQFKVDESGIDSTISEEVKTPENKSAAEIHTPTVVVNNPVEKPENNLEIKKELKARSTSRKVKFDSLAQLFESADKVPDHLFVPKEKESAAHENESISIVGDFENDSLHGDSSNVKIEMHDLAIKSMAHNADLVSETLADIHLKQGNYIKAIEMYERLMLHNPEKSNYFAAKIKELTVQERNS